MGKLILVLALVPGLAAVSGATANDLPKNTTQPKPKAPQTTANPCAQYGAGFVQVQGSTTCVRMNGSVRIDVGTSGRAR
jgi:Porin subfamily